MVFTQEFWILNSGSGPKWVSMDHDWNLGKGKMNDGDRSTVDALHRLLLAVLSLFKTLLKDNVQR